MSRRASAPTQSARRCRCRTTGDTSREDAAAQERSLERCVSMHAAAAEPGGLAGCVQAGNGSPPADSTRPSRSVCSPPSVLRVRMCSRTAISGPASGSSSRCGGAVRIKPVADVVARAADGDHLHVLGISVLHLPVARDDLALDRAPVEARVRRRSSAFIARHQRLRVRARR